MWDLSPSIHVSWNFLTSCVFWLTVVRIRNGFTVSHFYNLGGVLAKRRTFLSLTHTSASHALLCNSLRTV